jgi:Leucine-rich repeat (LRR) protein
VIHMESFFASVTSSFEKLGNDFSQAVDKLGSDYNRSANSERRQETARKTGIVSERNTGLTVFPTYVCDLGDKAKVVDLGGNKINTVPEDIRNLTRVQKLNLAANALTEIPQSLCLGMGNLKVLRLEKNGLLKVPLVIGSLVKLEELWLADNKLTQLPPSVSQLQRLRILNLARNELVEHLSRDDDEKDVADAKNFSGVEYLGYCANLTSLTLDGNAGFETLPPSLGGLAKLKTLSCDATSVQSVPKEVFKGCTALTFLSLKRCPVNVNELRLTPGFAEFDARRVQSRNKQIAGNVFSDGDDLLGDNDNKRR